MSDYNRKWAKEHKVQIARNSLRTHLRTRYNLTVEAYMDLVNKQNGLCAICFKPPTTHKRLCVDHCHKTNVIRGLLCHRCNAAIGLFYEDVENMWGMVEYLKRKDYLYL